MDPAVIQARVRTVDEVLAPLQGWSTTYWSRDDQLQALVEGWAMTMFRDRIARTTSFSWIEFDDDRAAQEYVLARAREGSDLHCRAMVLHVASVLKNGNPNT